MRHHDWNREVLLGRSGSDAAALTLAQPDAQHREAEQRDDEPRANAIQAIVSLSRAR